MQCSIEIKKFYFNTKYYISTPESLLDDLISLCSYNYYESFSHNSYVFHIDGQAEKFEGLLYKYSIPYRRIVDSMGKS
jgi:hypothetical protein